MREHIAKYYFLDIDTTRKHYCLIFDHFSLSTYIFNAETAEQGGDFFAPEYI